MHLKAFLSKLALRFFDHLFEAILGLLLIAGIAAYGTFFRASAKRLLDYAIATMNISTPLWATTVPVAVCILYAYLKARQYRNSVNPSPDLRKTKVEFIQNGDLKWKVFYFPDGSFNVHRTPFCTIHDLELHHFKDGYACYHINENGCKSRLRDSNYDLRKKYIESVAERQSRNKESS